MALCILSSAFFLLENNLMEVNCVIDGVCDYNSYSAVRSAIFMILEVTTIHPIVTFLLHYTPYWKVSTSSKSQDLKDTLKRDSSHVT